MMKGNDDESPRVALRLLIDEIVEDLSRSDTRFRSRSVKNQTCLGDAASYWVCRKACSKDNRGVKGSSKVALVGIHVSGCRLLRKQQKFPPPNLCPGQKPVMNTARWATPDWPQSH